MTDWPTEKRERLAKDIVKELLSERALGNSTFADEWPEAFADLCTYRDDMQETIEYVLGKAK